MNNSQMIIVQVAILLKVYSGHNSTNIRKAIQGSISMTFISPLTITRQDFDKT
jgi:hypothetical protein